MKEDKSVTFYLLTIILYPYSLYSLYSLQLGTYNHVHRVYVMSDVYDANDANDVNGLTGVNDVTDVTGLTGVNDENYASVAIGYGYALVVVLVAFLDCPCYQPCFPFDPFELSVVRSAFMECNQTLDNKIVI